MKTKIILKLILLASLLTGFSCSDSEEMTDADAVAADSSAIDTDDITFTGGDSAEAVTSDFTLPVSGENGSTVTWSSSDNTVISVSGGNAVVTPPYGTGDASITLTATVTKGGESATKTITITVTALFCGDSIFTADAGEACDDGGVQTANCEAECFAPFCGDGIVNVLIGEACDDANAVPGDGCNSSCQISENVNITGAVNADGLYSIYKVTDKYRNVYDHLITEKDGDLDWGLDPDFDIYHLFQSGNHSIIIKIGTEYYMSDEMTKAYTYNNATKEYTEDGMTNAMILPIDADNDDFYFYDPAKNWIADCKQCWIHEKLTKVATFNQDITKLSLLELRSALMKGFIEQKFTSGPESAQINLSVTYTGSETVSLNYPISIVIDLVESYGTCIEGYGDEFGNIIETNSGTVSFTNLCAGKYKIMVFHQNDKDFLQHFINSEPNDSYEFYNDLYMQNDEGDIIVDAAGNVVADPWLTLAAAETVNLTMEFDDTHKRACNDCGGETPITELVTLSNLSVTPAAVDGAGTVTVSMDIADAGIDGNINYVHVHLFSPKSLISSDPWQPFGQTIKNQTLVNIGGSTWSGDIAISEFNEAGEWKISEIFIKTDTENKVGYLLWEGNEFENYYVYWNWGNDWNVDERKLTTILPLSFTHTTSTEDITSPSLVSVDLLEFNDGVDKVKITVTTSDTGGSGLLSWGEPGYNDPHFEIYHSLDPDLDKKSNGFTEWNWNWGTSSITTPSPGVYEIVFPKAELSYTSNGVTYDTTTAGDFNLRKIWFYDAAGNKATYNAYTYYNEGMYTLYTGEGSPQTTAINMVSFSNVIETWQTLYFDDFNRADGALGIDWIVSDQSGGSGTASIINNQVLANYDTGALMFSYQNSFVNSPLKISVDFIPKGTGDYINDGGLIILDSGTPYGGCWWDNGPLTASLSGSADQYSVDNVLLVYGSVYTLVLEINNTDLTCSIMEGATEILSSTNSNSSSFVSGTVDIMAGAAEPNNAYLDNFKIEEYK
ncbi:MAG: DUF4215 domain-containing protein [Spirochaetia bacterium]|nr:DUF4215 domain-containing protein [Spirochaetia bacterium]